jgi:ATP-dependent Clp protease ATP-binding subunit ClpA
MNGGHRKTFPRERKTCSAEVALKSSKISSGVTMSDGREEREEREKRREQEERELRPELLDRIDRTYPFDWEPEDEGS